MKDRIIQPILAVIGGFCGFLYGNLNGLMYALIAFIVIDYVTGVTCGIAKHRLSSAIGFHGIAKKMLILMLVAVAHILDTCVIGNGAVIMSAVECFYIANEGISILENAGKLGLPLPKKMVTILEQLKSESEDK